MIDELKKIIEIAIPIYSKRKECCGCKDCNATQQMKEWQREQTLQRILNLIGKHGKDEGQQTKESTDQ